jgi:hypothetical protein
MKSLSRTLGVCATLFAVTTATVSLPAMAGIVDTQTLATQADLQTQRNDVRALMARDDVRSALAGYGVSPADLDARVNNLTQGELLQIQQQLDSLPAGGSAVGLVLSVILIFVLLDVLGATDVFPRI